MISFAFEPEGRFRYEFIDPHVLDPTGQPAYEARA
jgi:hypothetical protein